MPQTASRRARAPEVALRVSGALRRRMRRPRPPLSLPAVAGPIHPDDDMKHPDDVDGAHYARVGRSAVAAIGRALADAGRASSDVQSCLDMPCGYGRVLRLLAQEIAPERITACDINRQAIRFCAAQFGVRPLRSTPSLDRRSLGRHDLIWCGSLVTHLDEERVGQLLRSFATALCPAASRSSRSTPSRRAAARTPTGTTRSSARCASTATSTSPTTARSFSTGTRGTPREYLTRAFAAASAGHVRLVGHHPRGWDDHHDVLAFQRDT